MSSESDNIEAKLAAYIDGQLGESERAEIEKYLANNPQQAQVMRELMQGREWMRELPRESAPPEIMEAIQTSLERGQLLARPVEDEASGGGWWRQVVAIAAILVLAVGLAGLVYWVTHPPGIPKYSTAEMMPSKPIPATDEAANSAVNPAINTGVNTGAVTAPKGESAGNAGPVSEWRAGICVDVLYRALAYAKPRAARLVDAKRTGDVSQQVGNSVTADQNAPALTLSQVPNLPAVQTVPLAQNAPATPGQESQALNPVALNTNGPAQNTQAQNAFTQDLLAGGAPVNFYSQNANARNAPGQTVMVTRDVEPFCEARVTDYFARNNIAYEFSAMPADQNAQVNGGSRMNGVSQTANNTLAFQQVAQNNDKSRAVVQNQMIMARRVPADKVSEITRTISGKPLVLKAMDRAEVRERRLVAEKSSCHGSWRLALPTSGQLH